MLPEAIHEAVLRIQAETHSPQDLSVFLAQVFKGVHQLLQVRVGVHHVSCQDVVEAMSGTWETLIQFLTPDQLSDLKAEVGGLIYTVINQQMDLTGSFIL